MKLQHHFAIFDMDGTLVSSMEYWDMICAEFLAEQGIHAEGLLELMKPMTLPQSAVYLQQRFGCTFSAPEMIQRMCTLMRVHYERDVRLKPGVLACLEDLRRQGVRMCIASSTPIDLIGACLDALGLRRFFTFFVSSEEVGKGKTEPDIYLHAAKRLGAPPSDVIVFEDSLAAGTTAKQAGFAVAAVYDQIGATEWDAFCRMADLVIRDWTEYC